VARDLAKIRDEFPILRQMMRGKPLVYLDSAATTQKPKVVIDALVRYYEEENANIHRGVYLLAERATRAYEAARVKAQRFLNAASPREIVFTRGTTESINLVAGSYGRRHLGPGDEVIVSAMEHHSNIVPWQLICEERGARVRVIPMNDAGELLLDEYEKLLGPRTRLVAVAHISNALGTINPIARIASLARRQGVPVLVDGAQAAPHLPIDVRALGCDFYAISSHKMYGPTGIGVLYGREELLEQMPPYQGGGEMIRSVTWEETTYHTLPHKFEAGTPNIEGAIGLGAAIDFLESLGLDRVGAHEADLLAYATEALQAIPEAQVVGSAREKASILSFTLGDIHPHDVGTILDQFGIAVRAGHHCAQPVMERFGVPATVRASFGLYNTREDVDALIAGLRQVTEVFR
jgi:cysteine desulfurase/selenocysteine lyase